MHNESEKRNEIDHNVLQDLDSVIERSLQLEGKSEQHSAVFEDVTYYLRHIRKTLAEK